MINFPFKPIIVMRLIAKAIDLIIYAGVASILPSLLGPLAAVAYSLCADGFEFEQLRGRSIGKKVLGLKVVGLLDRKPCTLKQSMIRNSPIAVTTLFAALAPPVGWVIALVLGIPLLGMEVYLMFRMETGHRLGDAMADTEVVEERA